jgi:uncharacterized protein DUF5666
MKRFAIFVLLTLIVGLLLATTQAMASPAAVVAVKGTGGPHGPPTPHPTEGPGTIAPAPGNGSHPAGTLGAQATAHAGLHGKPQILRGTLTAVDPSSLTMTLGDGSSVTVGLTPDTKIHVPGPQAAGDTLLVGMQAMVMAFTDQNNALVARMVVAIPGQPVRVHRVGTVTAYSAGASITIKATDGNTYTFGLTADTKILLEDQAGNLAVGSLVTIIAPRVPSSLDWTAKGIVVHPGP